MAYVCPDSEGVSLKMRARAAMVVTALLLTMVTPALAQAPTGTISGRVVSDDGEPLPGVTVSVMSANLQGVRTAVTSLNGDYLVPLLPPGDYTVSFEIGNFQTVRELRNIAGTQNALLDVRMSPATISESVTVVGQAQPFVETAQVATNFKQDLMSTLPSNRTIDAVLLMAPALHATGPRGAYTINGSQSYENLYTLNGAIINENLRGAPMTPYIEDALQEVTVASAGVSAEYGRFSGGVANAITKSGGNIFSGSFRTSFANDDWRSFTPYESTQLAANPALELKLNKTVPTYEATLGGPITKERLWFFGAMRKQTQESTRTTVGTNLPYIRTNDEKRYEGKLTYTAKPGQTVQGSYLKMDQILHNFTGQPVADLKSLTDQGQPQSLMSVHYTGVVGANLSIEAQYSARRFALTNVGATTKDLIDGTLVLDLTRGFRYWSPTFCAGSTCDGDEERNNSDFIVKGSYFLSNKSSGSHHVVFGYDRYNDNITANTHGSGSDFRIRGTTSIIRGADIFPQFIPNSTTLDWTPILELSEGSNLRTHSVFINDNWRLNNHFSFGIGLRLDKSQATDGSGQNVGDDLTTSPRVSAIWDPVADGRWAVSGSYARYVMALTSNLAGSTAKAGNTATLRWLYQGAPINADSSGNLVSTPDAIRQVFDWFNANGGVDRRPLALASVPGVNMKMLEPLAAPYAVEYAGGVSRTLGSRGTARFDGVYREYNNFYSMRTDLSTGRVSDQFGNNFDLNVVENTNATERTYWGLITQINYNFNDRVALGGNYTLSHTYGNLEGETVNGGPSGASVANYPEYRRESWNYPQGDLLIDQRHRSRLWATYTAPAIGSAGMMTFGLVQQIGSGAPYGASGLINPLSFMSNPGYLTPPAQLEYLFTARDAFRTATTYRTDISINYAYRVSHLGGGQPELFFHGEVLNIFNQFQLCGCGENVFRNGGITDLTTIGQGARVMTSAPFNPYTTQPVQGVNWDYNSTFGTPLNAFAYTSPRIFRFSVGVRF
jgi:hypothetical protein